jgi:ABC-2 type transport system permease protein
VAGAFWLWPLVNGPASRGGVQAMLAVREALGSGDLAGFARAMAPRPFAFPDDHGPHPEFRTEWWYYTGNLETSAGRHVGFQLTFFRTALAPPVDFRVRAWYNPDLVSAIFIVPGLIGALLMQTTVSVMAISIVRERERGTLEALVVSPIRRWELLVGKIIPNLLVAYGQMTMALLVAHFGFDVPIRGSLVLLYVLSLLFMWGTLGVGIYVSAASRTVPQAMQLAFMTFLPSVYLSGLLFPIEGMPTGAQYLAAIIPLTYYLRVVRGIVLKGIGLEYLWPSLLPLIVFGAVVFTLSVLRFRKQLD